jgi:aspartyl/asparaginyl beta-hydroxylase (cupin superfamily)
MIDRALVRWSAIPDHEIYPNAMFPWTPELEANWRVVQAEAEHVLADASAVPPIRQFSPDHEAIARDDRWRGFVLWGYGLRWERNCARCPETARLLERIPGLLSAFFSVMQAGAHVPRHTGPTKAILTAHLGVKVPRRREDCHMQIGSRDFAWSEGRVVVFDDMYPHEVWNDTDEDRVILLLHVKRPQYFPGSLLREGLFAAIRQSSLVKDAMRNLDQWDRRPVAAE